MTGNNSNLDLVNISAYVKYDITLYQMCQKCCIAILTLYQMCQKCCIAVPNVPKMLHSNPNIDYVKFGEILSSCSQDIEQKQKSDINHRALTVVTNLQKMTANNPSPDLVNINAYTKFVKFY